MAVYYKSIGGTISFSSINLLKYVEFILDTIDSGISPIKSSTADVAPILKVSSDLAPTTTKILHNQSIILLDDDLEQI